MLASQNQGAIKKAMWPTSFSGVLPIKIWGQSLDISFSSDFLLMSPHLWLHFIWSHVFSSLLSSSLLFSNLLSSSHVFSSQHISSLLRSSGFVSASKFCIAQHTIWRILFLSKNALRARLPSKTASCSCENEALGRDLLHLNLPSTSTSSKLSKGQYHGSCSTKLPLNSELFCGGHQAGEEPISASILAAFQYKDLPWPKPLWPPVFPHGGLLKILSLVCYLSW